MRRTPYLSSIARISLNHFFETTKLSPFVIGHHDIQLAPSARVIEVGHVETQRSIQTNIKRSISVSSRQAPEAGTHREVEDCPAQGVPPTPGQPDQRLNILLDILVGYQGSLQN
jgi:hypothetical protein